MDLSVLEPDLSEYLADHPGVSIYGGIIATTMTLLTQVPKPMLNNCLFNPSYSWALSEQNAAVQLMGGKLEELLSSVSILPLDLD